MSDSSERPVSGESTEKVPVYETVLTSARVAALADYTFENEILGPTGMVESILRGILEGLYKPEGRVLANLQKHLKQLGENTPLYREALRLMATGRPVPIRNLGSSSASLSQGDLIDLPEVGRRMQQSKQRFVKTGLAHLQGSQQSLPTTPAK